MIVSNLVLAFTILLLAVSLIYSRLPLAIKVLCICTTSVAVAFNIYSMWIDRGLSTPVSHNSEFLVSHTLVREPNPKLEDKGAIYLVILENVKDKIVPRLYEKAYSENLHKQAQNIQNAIEEQQGPVWVYDQNLNQKSKQGSYTDRVIDKMINNFAQGLGLYNDDSEPDLFINENKQNFVPKQ